MGRASASFLINRFRHDRAERDKRLHHAANVPSHPVDGRRYRRLPDWHAVRKRSAGGAAGADSALQGRAGGGFRAGGGRSARILIRMRGEWRPGMHGALDIGDVTVLRYRWLGTAVAGEY